VKSTDADQHNELATDQFDPPFSASALEPPCGGGQVRVTDPVLEASRRIGLMRMG